MGMRGRRAYDKMREAGKMCERCNGFLRDRCCPNCGIRIYMSFFERPEGWVCGFLEMDMKTAVSRRRTFRDVAKLIEIVERGGGFKTLADRQGLDEGIRFGRGGVYLHLTAEQYRKLKE